MWADEMMRCVASIGYGANEEMLEVTISLIDTGLWRLEKTRRIERGLFALASPLSQTQIMGNLSFVILSIIGADKQSKAHLYQNTKPLRSAPAATLHHLTSGGEKSKLK